MLKRVIENVALPAMHGRYCTDIDMSAHITGGEALADGVTRLVSAVTQPTGDDAARRILNNLLAIGYTPQQVLVETMLPAARALEAATEQDRLSTLSLTLATCQLRMLAVELTSHGSGGSTDVRRCASIVSIPGDTLKFAPMVDECLLRLAGWEVEKLEGLSLSDITERLQYDDPALTLFVLNDHRLWDALSTASRRCARATAGQPMLFMGIGDGVQQCDEAMLVGSGLHLVSPDARRTLRHAAAHGRALDRAAAVATRPAGNGLPGNCCPPPPYST